MLRIFIFFFVSFKFSIISSIQFINNYFLVYFLRLIKYYPIKSYAASIYLILYSPPEMADRKPEVFDYSPPKSHRSFPIGYRQRIATCTSGYARPLPKMYWEVINEIGQVVDIIQPTHGHFSENPAIIDSADENFYHNIELNLLPEHGFQVQCLMP